MRPGDALWWWALVGGALLVTASVVEARVGDDGMIVIDDSLLAVKELNLDPERLEKTARDLALDRLTEARQKMLKSMDELKASTVKYKKAVADHQKAYAVPADAEGFQAAIANAVWPGDGMTLAMAVVSRAHLPLARNFLCYLRSHEPQPTPFLLWAADRYTFEVLKDEGFEGVMPLPQHYGELDLGEGVQRPPHLLDALASDIPLPPDSIHRHRLQLARDRIGWEVLQRGYNVLLADMDQVWTENPLLHMDLEEDVMLWALNEGTRAEGAASTGFVFIKSQATAVSLWAEVITAYGNQLSEEWTAAAEKASVKTGDELHLRRLLAENVSEDAKFGLLGLDIFSSGEHFFRRRIPTKKGIIPYVVRLNVMEGILQKRGLCQRSGLWLLDEKRNPQCPIDASRSAYHALNGAPDVQPSMAGHTAKQYRVTIKVFAFNRTTSLLRLLNSLRSAYYDGDEVDLEIFVDHMPASSPLAEDGKDVTAMLLTMADAFKWPHGGKRIIFHAHNHHIRDQWLSAWYPSSETATRREFAVFLEDDVEVSNFYYRFLTTVIREYYMTEDPLDHKVARRMMSVSLQRPWLNAAKFPERAFAPLDTDAPVLYQLPSTWGVLFSASQWRAFRHWYEATVQEALIEAQENGLSAEEQTRAVAAKAHVEGRSVTNAWALHSGGKMLLPWLTRFAFESGRYTLYPNLPKNFALAVNHQLAGAYLDEDIGPDARLLERLEDLPPVAADRVTDLGTLRYLSVYNLCGDVVLYSDLDEYEKLPMLCHGQPPEEWLVERAGKDIAE